MRCKENNDDTPRYIDDIFTDNPNQEEMLKGTQNKVGLRESDVYVGARLVVTNEEND